MNHSGTLLIENLWIKTEDIIELSVAQVCLLLSIQNRLYQENNTWNLLVRWQKKRWKKLNLKKFKRTFNNQ